MSVSILVEFKDPEKESIVLPVAFQSNFRNDWVPMAEQLGLEWIPHFYDGGTMTVADLPAVLDEFRQIRTLLINNPPKFVGPRENIERLIERADMLLEYLEPLDLNDIADVYVG